MINVSGTGSSTGVAIGIAYVNQSVDIQVPDFDDPKGAFEATLKDVAAELKALAVDARSAGREEAASVLEAQSLMADDPMLRDAVAERLGSGESLQPAIEESADDLASMLAQLDDEYIAARSADVLEVSSRIVRKLGGVGDDGWKLPDEPCVIVAKNLTAAETATLDPATVLGFITEEGGPTGHVSVIARSLGIPAVVGAAAIADSVVPGGLIAMDGGTGEVVIDPDRESLDGFDRRAKELARQREAASRFKGKQVRFGASDISIAANVGSSEEVSRAVMAQSDGIGLYRTEFLFLDRTEPPSEDEQYRVYSEALASFSDPVVIRTFDIGGDKPASYLDMPLEENPFLGERGVRVYREFDSLFRTQIRAMLRASVEGDLWIMVPMVATKKDLVQTLELIEQSRAELSGSGVAMGQPRVGIMIEVPSAALVAGSLSSSADFFSIGTNDLTQYTLAADRTNGRLNEYSDAAHPAVLKLCRQTAEAGKAAGIQTSVCGAAAADPLLAVLFAAMGIAKLSVAPMSVDLVRSAVSQTDPEKAKAALEWAMTAADASEVRSDIPIEL